MRATEFTKLDKNFNGFIEQNEFPARILQFEQFDANTDGKLELSEYIGKHYAMFKKADTNGNGNINLQEFSRIQQSIREKNGQP